MGIFILTDFIFRTSRFFVQYLSNIIFRNM
nr:MAG TPA: hypothetical protein [Caudoviricetes sp.]